MRFARSLFGLLGWSTLLLSVGCDPIAVRLDTHELASHTMNVSMHYAVWTPQDFREDEELPIVLFLHGRGDDHRSFDRYRVGQLLDAALEAGEIPRAVIVLPEGHNGFWCNWHDRTRHYEDWAMHEVFPRVQREYHTQRCPEGCHLMGISMGGAGVIQFMTGNYTERFSSAAILSAPLMNSAQINRFIHHRIVNVFMPVHRIFGQANAEEIRQIDPFIQWRRPEDVPFRLYLAWAENDRDDFRDNNRSFHRHLTTHDIAHGHEEFEGGHNWISWRPVIVRALAHNLAGE